MGEEAPGQVGVYGMPPSELMVTPAGALQLSPLIPGSAAIEALADGALDAAIVVAPPATVERRYVLAQAVRATRPGGCITAMAPKDKGGARIARELAAFGAAAEEVSKRHWRLCDARRPAEPQAIVEAIAEGGPRFLDALGLWSQPGVFSWDRIDPGSARLAAHLPPLAGRCADLGCGTGYLAKVALAASREIEVMLLTDIDRRAIDCARWNIADPRARFAWADVRDLPLDGPPFYAVIMNPPFHDAGHEDRALGQAFIRRAAELLCRGGKAYLVANRHLPYESVLASAFASVRPLAEGDGFKIYEAIR